MKIYGYELLPKEKQNICECDICKAKKSVKYIATVEFSKGMILRLTVCNKCVLIYKDY